MKALRTCRLSILLRKSGLWLCWMLGLLSSPALTAQQDAYPFNFTYLSKDNGLPHNFCHTALRDKRGFLWFGTQDGLARYDGVRFNVYPYLDDSTGLSAPTVFDLDEDAHGNLWVATVGGGLNRFNPVTGEFTWYQNDPRDSTTLPGNDLTNLLIDADGSIWVGGLSSGLSRFNPKTERFQNVALAQNLTTAEDRLKRNSVTDIASDSNDSTVLWLAANDGIFRFHKKSGRLEHFPTEMPCNDVLADTPGVVWVATDGGGIALMDKKTGRWQFFPPLPEAWARRNLSTNLIADISRKSAHEFWVASLDLGFGIFDLKTKAYRFFNTQSKLLAGQTNQSANGLYRDPTGLLWIFNHKNGISLLGPASNVFDYTPLPADGCQSQTVNEPQDFAWNSNWQELYVVTTGCRGLYVYEPVQRVEPVQLSGQSPYRLKYAVGLENGGIAHFNRVLIDRRGRVWIGGQPRAGTSLFQYNPGQHRLSPFRHPDAATLQGYTINDLAEDHAGNIWVATTQGGLFRINFQKNTVDHFLRGDDFDGARTQIVDLVCFSAPAEVPAKNRAASGAVPPEEQVWFSTKEAGVFCFYPLLNKFIRYGHQPGKKTGLAEDYVTAIEHGAGNSVWVGTASRGLHRIPLGTPANAMLPSYTVKNGLAFNSIHRLALAPDGTLWVATEKGISVFRPETQTFKTYDESDGLADTYLRRKGFRWCTSGEIFVGQTKGFYSFHPNAIYHNHTPPVLAFTGFDLFGKSYQTEKDLNVQPEIRLQHDQNFFTIHFAALNFSQANRNQYFYQLGNIDPGWIAAGNKAEVSYTRVPPGKYAFRVRARNNSGVASTDELVLNIIIEPAFYQTWWFRLLVLLALIAGIVTYFRTRLTNLLKQEAAKNELNRLRALKAELENKALRSQMNPHFIFNALNTIEALIIEENPDAASALLQKFSKLVRLVLENSQHPKIALKAELEALELYLQLEVIRLDDRFTYRIDVDPELEQHHCYLPPMILQPFAENAILHGLRHLHDRKGLLTVRLRPETAADGKKYLHCEIEDNGIGRAQAAEINARTRISGKKQSLGSRLTSQRVELLNTPGNQDYTVEITDLSGTDKTGTLVTILLPLEYTNNQDRNDINDATTIHT
ncbi:MAG: histidine kinase [Saprospiraceae bacterium]|nr:histidine kinase [Saprospiraceae bacterium]